MRSRAFFVALVLVFLSGCKPHFSAPVQKCKEVTELPEYIDYEGGDPGPWVKPDGKVIGYSMEEDGTIYTTAECARIHS